MPENGTPITFGLINRWAPLALSLIAVVFTYMQQQQALETRITVLEITLEKNLMVRIEQLEKTQAQLKDSRIP